MNAALLRYAVFLGTGIFMVSACGGGTIGQRFLPPGQTQSSNITAQGSLATPIGAQSLPIGARALPIGALAIPIVSRNLASNFTNAPQTAPVCGLTLLICTAIRRLDIVPALTLPISLISGYQPNDLASAYSIPAGGTVRTLAIVVAFDNPRAASDLAVYRSTFGLPACTSASGCLRMVNEQGSAALPRADESWGQELSIDLDMASAVCASCKLLVVEAASADIDALTQAMQTAVRLGANVVSNSYTTPETAAVASEDAQWNHPGVAIVAGSGDNGYGVGWPAASSHVTAVGGTTLLPVLPGWAWLEVAWQSGGSGCSRYIAKPSWQHDSRCGNRTVADIAAVANPVPGVAVYDTYFANPTNAGWNVYGGTSVATPIIAGMYALANDGGSAAGASSLYLHASALNDIILGVNGLCLNELCTAGFGYDGPTGNGTPNGTTAF